MTAFAPAWHAVAVTDPIIDAETDRRVRLLTFRDLARAWRVSERTVRRLADSGVLRTTRICSLRRVSLSEAERHAQEHGHCDLADDAIIS